MRTTGGVLYFDVQKTLKQPEHAHLSRIMLAQLVEHSPLKRFVVGSNPMHFKMQRHVLTLYESYLIPSLLGVRGDIYRSQA